VEDVADGARDDARVGVGAVHGESLAAAGLPVGEGRAVEPVDGGADEGADDRRVDPLVRRRPVEHVVCGTNHHAGQGEVDDVGRRGEERVGEGWIVVPKAKDAPGTAPAVRWMRETRDPSSMRHSRSAPPEQGEGSAAAGLGGRKRTATEIFSMGEQRRRRRRDGFAAARLGEEGGI
jgi:hypothetical protein